MTNNVIKCDFCCYSLEGKKLIHGSYLVTLNIMQSELESSDKGFLYFYLSLWFLDKMTRRLDSVAEHAEYSQFNYDNFVYTYIQRCVLYTFCIYYQ